MHLDVTPPLLVFGGPYSNLRSLAALRVRADELGIPASQAICTGDVVAYCAEPEETTQAIRDWGCRVIAGNCEEQLAEASDNCACGFEAGTECDLLAKGWYPFANARMSPESRTWMAALPKTITFTAGGLTFRGCGRASTCSAGRARRDRPAPRPAHAAHSGPAARSRSVGRNNATAALRRCDVEAGQYASLLHPTYSQQTSSPRRRGPMHVSTRCHDQVRQAHCIYWSA